MLSMRLIWNIISNLLNICNDFGCIIFNKINYKLFFELINWLFQVNRVINPKI